MLALELLIACVTPYPWLINVKYTEYNKTFDTHLQYGLNEILLFFSFFRGYHFFRFFLQVTKYMTPRS